MPIDTYSKIVIETYYPLIFLCSYLLLGRWLIWKRTHGFWHNSLKENSIVLNRGHCNCDNCSTWATIPFYMVTFRPPLWMVFLRKRKRFNQLFSEGRSNQNVEDEAATVVQVVDMNQNREQQIVDSSFLCSVANADPIVLSNSEMKQTKNW